MQKSYLRGHEIEFVDGRWLYTDTKAPTAINGVYNERSCGHCGLPQTSEGHDGCLGTLPEIMNACCGHGQIDEAYAQFPDTSCIRGYEAVEFIKKFMDRRDNHEMET